MTECAPEMPVKSALVPMGAESVRRCSSVPPMREGAHFGAGLKSPCQPGTFSLLLSKRAYPNAIDLRDESPLLVAKRVGHGHIVSALLVVGFDSQS